MRSLPTRAARDDAAPRAKPSMQAGSVTPLLAAGNRAIAELLGGQRRARHPGAAAAGPGARPVVQRQNHDRLVQANDAGEATALSPFEFGRVLESKLRRLDAAVHDLGRRSETYHLYRSGRGERAASRGVSAPLEAEPGLVEQLWEGANTAVSYVSDAAGGTWQPTAEQLTEEPRRHLESARDALYSGATLEPSTRESDWEAAIRHMQTCESAIEAGARRWNRYLDETQSGAERAAVTLGVVRDLSFTVVSAIATGGAATVAEGAVLGAGVSLLGEAATQEGETLSGLRDRPDLVRLAAATGGGAVSGGMGAAVTPMGGPLATRIGRGMVAGGLTAATEETTRQTIEQAFGERTATDYGRIGAAGFGGTVTGGLLEAASGVAGRGSAEPSVTEIPGRGQSEPSGAPEVAGPPTAREPGGVAGRETHAEDAAPETTPRALGEREALLPPEPGPRAPGERTAAPPQDPEGYMPPLPAEPPAPVRRWPGRQRDLLDDADIRKLSDEEVDTALRYIEGGVDPVEMRYRFAEPTAYENQYRRGGDEGALPPGFVDRRGVVVLPEASRPVTRSPGHATPTIPDVGHAPTLPGGRATIPGHATPTIPDVGHAPTLPGGRATIPGHATPTIPDVGHAPTLPGGRATIPGHATPTIPDVGHAPTLPGGRATIPGHATPTIPDVGHAPTLPGGRATIPGHATPTIPDVGHAPTLPGGRATIPGHATPTIPESPSRAPTLPAGDAHPAAAPEATGSPTIVEWPSRASTIPVGPRPEATYRALTADDAQAIAADLAAGTSRPGVIASQADSFDESFRAIHGADAPLPEYGYVDDAGHTFIRFELLER